MHQAVGLAINETLDNSNSSLQQLTDNINSVLTDGLTDKLDKVDCQLKDLETEIITTAIGGKGYEKLSSQILSLREERGELAQKISEEVDTHFDKNIVVDFKSELSMAVEI